ncbi:PhzF family phenazine biosynthesis protein [Streptomyces sp. NPDC048424]|uniref:PhzF family phenazine biosynthesis protein n=1 Tax=Streptomyces sp. NPDC048424 TaxID=3155265 RepID=UPI0034418FDA
MRYHHVDVFTDRPYGGNSLAVFPDADALTWGRMRAITRELRHFESVFLLRDGSPAHPRRARARVFDLTGELDFAGHPLIGAAAVLHALHGAADHEAWTLRLPARTVEVTTERRGPGRYASLLDQGLPPSSAAPPRRGSRPCSPSNRTTWIPACRRRSSPSA